MLKIHKWMTTKIKRIFHTQNKPFFEVSTQQFTLGWVSCSVTLQTIQHFVDLDHQHTVFVCKKVLGKQLEIIYKACLTIFSSLFVGSRFFLVWHEKVVLNFLNKVNAINNPAPYHSSTVKRMTEFLQWWPCLSSHTSLSPSRPRIKSLNLGITLKTINIHWVCP